MIILELVLKGKWYDMIERGAKLEEYREIKPYWDKRLFSRSNNKWKVGCFYGSGKDLIAKAYKDSEKSGREYERVVNYVESILKEENNDDEYNKDTY